MKCLGLKGAFLYHTLMMLSFQGVFQFCDNIGFQSENKEKNHLYTVGRDKKCMQQVSTLWWVMNWIVSCLADHVT